MQDTKMQKLCHKRDYEINENNETDENKDNFRLFRYFRLFRNPSSCPFLPFPALSCLTQTGLSGIHHP